LLLLHGWGASSANFGPVIGALHEKFTVLAPDLPGFGFSDQPLEPWGSYEYAGVVARLAAEVEASHFHVLGHSFGGRVALALSCAYPGLVKKLVLVDSPGIRVPAAAKLALKGCLYRALRFSARALPPPQRESVLSWARQLLGSPDYRAAGPLRGTLVKLLSEDFRTKLPGILSPTLVIWGDHDTEVPLDTARIMAQEIPHAELMIIPNAGHFPFLDQPKAFTDTVIRFLEAEAVRE